MADASEAIVTDLKARQDIHDVLVRYCRGADLCDVEMMRSCYHEDAIDDHGFFAGAADAFVESAAENLGTLFSATRHFMTNEYVEVTGDFAHAETYILCHLKMSRGEDQFDITARCRYLDRFERRNGIWKIMYRQLVSDGTRVDKVEEDFPRLNQGAPGSRGEDDPSRAFFEHYRRRKAEELV